MRTMQRRQVIAGAGALAAGLGVRRPALAQGKPRVVVIGGGPGGATAAKYLARDSEGAIAVTLVEPLKEFTTCFHSNLYLAGLRDWASITHGYDALAGHGVALNREAAQAIDRERRTVRLADGSDLPYDRLVVAPGIDIRFDSVPGYSEEAAGAMPHAWKPGAQTQLLKKRLDALEDGSTIVMVAPRNPYRCPPGPYERVSMMAHVLKTKGHTKSKIIILDPKEAFSKQGLFLEGWERHYPGMIEWQEPAVHGGVKGVDPREMTVTTDLETYKADLANIIPAQMAGKIARAAGLANAAGWCPIDPASMKSAADPNVFVVGDAATGGDMPKSAFTSNSQARVAAATIRSELLQTPAVPARYANTCWSMIAPEDAVKVGGSYEPREGRIAAVDTFISQKGESSELRQQTQDENMDWYGAIVADMFG